MLQNKANRVCSIYRTPLCCYGELIRFDQFIYPVGRNGEVAIAKLFIVYFSVPLVLKSCTDVIETHGLVDGIYRLSGITSNIQKLR